MINQAHSVTHLTVYMISAEIEWMWGVIGIVNLIFYDWMTHRMDKVSDTQCITEFLYNKRSFFAPNIPFSIVIRTWAYNSVFVEKWVKWWMVQCFTLPHFFSSGVRKFPTLLTRCHVDPSFGFIPLLHLAAAAAAHWDIWGTFKITEMFLGDLIRPLCLLGRSVRIGTNILWEYALTLSYWDTVYIHRSDSLLQSSCNEPNHHSVIYYQNAVPCWS